MIQLMDVRCSTEVFETFGFSEALRKWVVKEFKISVSPAYRVALSLNN